MARWLATAWFEVAALRSRSGPWPGRERPDALGERGDGHVVGGLFGVEVLLGDELVVVEGLGAVVVELLLLEIGLGLRRCWPRRSSRRRRRLVMSVLEAAMVACWASTVASGCTLSTVARLAPAFTWSPSLT